MAKIYGYLRVSTDKQNIDNNKNEIKLNALNMGFNHEIVWVSETVSGSKHWKKRQLGELINQFNEGDIFITSEVSRIGRSMLQILEFITECSKKKVSIYCTKGGFKIDDSIESQASIFALSLSSQIERNLISERTKAALKTRKENGIILGRPKGKLKLDKYTNEIKELIDTGVKYKAIAEKYNVSQNTMSKFIKDKQLKNK